MVRRWGGGRTAECTEVVDRASLILNRRVQIQVRISRHRHRHQTHATSTYKYKYQNAGGQTVSPVLTSVEVV